MPDESAKQFGTRELHLAHVITLMAEQVEEEIGGVDDVPDDYNSVAEAMFNEAIG
jgi:hypothetical protein